MSATEAVNSPPLDGAAIVYCDGALGTPNGKTAHGLIRFTRRYTVLSVIDRRHAGVDAGVLLDGRDRRIPVVADLASAMADATRRGQHPTHFVVGLAPDGGRLPDEARKVVATALERGLHVDCGLHDFLSDDPVLAGLAKRAGVRIRDVRKTPPRDALHHFSGRIAEVSALKVAVLGTDSAVGKRTTAWMIVQALEARGISAEMIGTGQTAWMQGVRYGFILDSMINDFVAGEIEHAVLSAWDERRPQVIVLEGQGSLMNPAYPGGLELLAAGRPEAVVLQCAPGRPEYDGFEGFPIEPIEHQIRALEMVSGRPVVALTVNHEGLELEAVPQVCRDLERQTGLVTCDPVLDGVEPIVARLLALREGRGHE